MRRKYTPAAQSFFFSFRPATRIHTSFRAIITVHLLFTAVQQITVVDACQNGENPAGQRRQPIPQKQSHTIQTRPVKALVKYEHRGRRVKGPAAGKRSSDAAKVIVIDPNCVPTNKWVSNVSPGWCARNCLDGCGKTNCEQICIDRKAKKAYDDLVAERGPSCVPTRRWSKHVSARWCNVNCVNGCGVGSCSGICLTKNNYAQEAYITQPYCLPTPKWRTKISAQWCQTNCLGGCGSGSCYGVCAVYKPRARSRTMERYGHRHVQVAQVHRPAKPRTQVRHAVRDIAHYRCVPTKRWKHTITEDWCNANCGKKCGAASCSNICLRRRVHMRRARRVGSKRRRQHKRRRPSKRYY